MRMRISTAALLGLAVAAGASATALAQDHPTAQLQLTGTYQVKNVIRSEDGTVNMDFSAKITNNGPKDVSGKLLLRDYADNEKVWGRFGDNTIAAGGSVTVSGNVTVPVNIFTSWSGQATPPVFIYAEDSRGDLTMVNIPVVREGSPPPAKNVVK